MNKNTELNRTLHNSSKYLLTIFLIAGLVVSCDQITGSGDKNKETEQPADYTAYGLPNNLQWKVSNLQNNQQYKITISNVSANGESRDFSYDLRLM